MTRHPAFSAGIDGFVKNLTNPNKSGTIAFKEWLAGYDHAYFLNLKLNYKMKEQGLK